MLPSVRKRILLLMACAMGAAFGLFGASLLWQFLYAIGDRVISDEMFYRWDGTVGPCGAVFGAITAMLRGLLLQRWLFATVFLQHFLGALAGFAGATVSWRAALVAYVGVQTLVLLASAGLNLSSTNRSKNVNERTM